MTSFADTGLDASTTYTYRVQAYNSAGASSYTGSVDATTGSGTSSSSMRVETIVLGEQSAGKGQTYGTAAVTVVDGSGTGVPDATVSGTFSGAFTDSATAVTDASGTATLVSSTSAKGNVSFELCVDDITHASQTYDASANTVTCSGDASKRTGGDPTDLSFALESSYPNPLRTSAVIEYSLPTSQRVQLVLYNILGEKVAVLVDGSQARGTHRVTVRADQLPSGPYLYRLTAGDRQESRMMTVVK